MLVKSFLSFAAVAVSAVAAADSNLDWYGPKQYHTQVCGFPGDEHPQNCDDFHNDVANGMINMARGTCKDTSCSGTFEYFKFRVSIDAVFPPEAKGEFLTQLGNIIHKMFAHENQKGITSIPIETKLSFPSKMILNRFGDGNEKGHLEMTVSVDSEDGLCDILKKIGTAASVIPEVGPFFGLINIADC